MRSKADAHPEVSGSREVLPVFMEGHGHDPVCGEEGLLYSVPMVDVYINVQHPLVVPGREGQHRQRWDKNTHFTGFSQSAVMKNVLVLVFIYCIYTHTC